jgi:single-strand DNA-binding protein
VSLNLNRNILAGNLTRDPVVTQAGASVVAKFGLAINRKFKRGDETVEEVTFVDVEAWGRTAELVGQYLNKGSGCFIEGRLKLDIWEDKKTGEMRSKIKVVADSVQFLGQRQPAEDRDDAPAAPTAAPAAPRPAPPVRHGADPADDEPPF